MGAPPRLTADQVADARRRYAAGTATWAELAAAHQVSVSAIKAALSGRTWAAMTNPPPVRRHPDAPPGSGTARRFTEKQVAQLAGLRGQGLTWREIGQRYDVHPSVALRNYQQAQGQRPAVQQAIPARTARDADRRLCELWMDPTLTVLEIARMVDSTQARLMVRTRTLGLPQKRTVRAARARRVIAQLWPDTSLSLADIGDALGITTTGVRYHAQAMRLPPR